MTRAPSPAAQWLWYAHYRPRWTVEQLLRTMKSQGFDVEASLLADGEALESMAATVLVAAAQALQLVQARGEAGRHVLATRLFAPTTIAVLTVLCGRLEGRTDKSHNPHPRDSLAWAAWIVGRLGGWKGTAGERPPGPITWSTDLERLEAIVEGYALALHGAEGS